MPYDDVLVVQVGTPNFALVLAARSEHASGRGIIWSLDHLANEAELPCSYHILDAWYIIKHLKNLLVLYLALVNIAH